MQLNIDINCTKSCQTGCYLAEFLIEFYEILPTGMLLTFILLALKVEHRKIKKDIFVWENIMLPFILPTPCNKKHPALYSRFRLRTNTYFGNTPRRIEAEVSGIFGVKPLLPDYLGPKQSVWVSCVGCKEGRF